MTPAEAFEWLVALIKAEEGFSARAYPDPASDLSKALAKRGLLRKYKAGTAEIPADLRELDGRPWTIGHGETLGVKEGMWWTLVQADARLRVRLVGFMAGVVERCPILRDLEIERLIACTSLAYNIGLEAFRSSSVRRYTMRREFDKAAASFAPWKFAQGQVMPGLVKRRALEASIYSLSYRQS